MPPQFLIASQIAAVTAIILGLFLVTRLIQSRMLHTTLRRAIDRDPSAAVELIDRIDRRTPGTGDARNGLILVALGLALAGFGWLLDDNPTRLIYGASLFPILVGAALLGRAWYAARTPAADKE